MRGLKNRKIFWIILSIFLLLIFVLLYIKFFNIKKGEKKSKDNTIEKNIKFNKKEQEIVDVIYKEFESSDYFDYSNLKLFEIVNLELYGYYESKSNILYIRVEYKSECKDGTYDCDNLAIDKEYSISNNEPFAFFIKIDINNYNYIERIDGISAHINSDWVADYKRIE